MFAFLRLIPLRAFLWAGLAVSLLGYHWFAVYQAASEARTEEAAKWKDSIAKVNEQAKADHDTQQARIDELAKAAQPELAKKIAQQQKLVDLLVAEAKKPPKVFTKDCTLPIEQVNAYNGIK